MNIKIWIQGVKETAQELTKKEFEGMFEHFIWLVMMERGVVLDSIEEYFLYLPLIGGGLFEGELC